MRCISLVARRQREQLRASSRRRRPRRGRRRRARRRPHGRSGSHSRVVLRKLQVTRRATRSRGTETGARRRAPGPDKGRGSVVDHRRRHGARRGALLARDPEPPGLLRRPGTLPAGCGLLRPARSPRCLPAPGAGGRLADELRVGQLQLGERLADLRRVRRRAAARRAAAAPARPRSPSAPARGRARPPCRAPGPPCAPPRFISETIVWTRTSSTRRRLISAS